MEASRIFYSEHRLNFCCNEPSDPKISIAAVVPFLEDRSEGSRLLMKQVKCLYIPTNYSRDSHLVSKEKCIYLSRKERLEPVTLNFHYCYTPADHVSNVDKQTWVQQLVLLVTNLHTLRFDEYQCDDEFMRAALTYLKSKMDKASTKVSQTQTVQQLAHDGAASEE